MANPNDPIVRLQNWWANIGTTTEYNAWKATVPNPTPPPAPAAPSADQMQSWTPAQMYQATAQKFDAWKTNSLTYTPEPDQPQPPKDYSLLYLAAFMAAVSLIVVMKR